MRKDLNDRIRTSIMINRICNAVNIALDQILSEHKCELNTNIHRYTENIIFKFY